jgi:glycosyltransferase involved in cell wall biosynthesis
MRTKNQDRVERLAFGAATKIVVNSQAVADHMVARGVKNSRLELIYNGVGVARFDAAATRAHAVRRAYDIPEGTRLVTLVANLRHSVKNVPMFLRVADRLTQKLDDVRFVIAGEGEMKSDLEAMAAQLGIEAYVYFTGRCDDIPALLAASSACVLTSMAEGFSNSILEYMAAGKPVVATNVGGASEAIVDGETGSVVMSNDDEEMAERLNELLNDKALAAKLGTAGRQRVIENFSIERQLTKTVELYNRLIA